LWIIANSSEPSLQLLLQEWRRELTGGLCTWVLFKYRGKQILCPGTQDIEHETHPVLLRTPLRHCCSGEEKTYGEMRNMLKRYLPVVIDGLTCRRTLTVSAGWPSAVTATPPRVPPIMLVTSGEKTGCTEGVRSSRVEAGRKEATSSASLIHHPATSPSSAAPPPPIADPLALSSCRRFTCNAISRTI